VIHIRDKSAAATLRRIRAVTDAALSSLDLDALLVELLERTRELLSVDTAAILLVDPTGQDLVATAASGLEEEIRLGLRVPIGHGFTGRIAATGNAITIDHVDTDTVASHTLIDKKLAVMAGVPMFDGRRVIGVLHVGSLAPRLFTADDLDLLRLVADRAAMATQARLSSTERAATLALQRSLLPARLHEIPGLDVAARYVPGAEIGVGGDWYDLFDLPSGHVGVVIGDVAGNGLQAAVVMGRIRSALRAYALETDDPADVLARLDRKVQRFESGAMTTACYAVIAPDHRTIAVSSAGHPPPLRVTASGSWVLRVRPDPPLGAFSEVTRVATVFEVGRGDALVFYTDGLVEQRDRSIVDCIDELARTLPHESAERICGQAIARLGQQQASDDVAVLTVRVDR